MLMLTKVAELLNTNNNNAQLNNLIYENNIDTVKAYKYVN